MPDTENPSTPKREPLATTLTPAEITDEEFHTLSDAFLEKVHEKAEQVQEGREDVEVDYSVSDSFRWIVLSTCVHETSNTFGRLAFLT
jgi:hypothetical protein